MLLNIYFYLLNWYFQPLLKKNGVTKKFTELTEDFLNLSLDLCEIIENGDLSPHVLSIYLHALLKLKGMSQTLVRLSDLLDRIPRDDLQRGIKFLAVMQQGDHELFDFALRTYNLDLALLTAEGSTEK